VSVSVSGLVNKVFGSWRGAAGVATLAVAFAAPSHAQAACAGTLSGTYGLQVSGATTQGVSKFLTGVLSFNSACAVTGDIAVGENNVATAFGPLIAGSYATNADGSVTLSLTVTKGGTPETYAIGYSPAFNEAVGAEMDASAVATIDLKPQAPPGTAAVASYSNVSLKGAFVASCSGNTGSFTDLNDFTFDGTSTSGVGNITAGTDYYNNYGQSGVEPYTGQYAVNADGTLTGNVVVAGTLYGITGVIDNAANEVQFVYSINGADITACSAKRVIAPVTASAPAKYFACHVTYSVTSGIGNLFTGVATISNNGTVPLGIWNVKWTFANGQILIAAQNATFHQASTAVTMSSIGNPTITAGGTSAPITFTGLWNRQTNAVPTSFSVNDIACN
jgi:hypothetical protein